MDANCQVYISNKMVEINHHNRWAIYRRLQELDIPCECSAYQPLTIRVETAEIAVQLWSVTRQFTQSCRQLAQELDKSWQLYSHNS